MAGKLLSTFAFQFLVRDRQQKCDSVLPKEKRRERKSHECEFVNACEYITEKNGAGK